LRFFCFCSSFFQDFYHEGMLNFVKGFFFIYWDDYMIFVIYSVYVLAYYVYWFVYIGSSSYHWNEASLIMVYDLFNLGLNPVCRYFIEYFVYVQQGNLCIVFFFFCCVLIWFGYYGNIGFIEDEFCSIPSLSFLWNSLRSTSLSCSLKAW
jgi:hypothetical protein